jgi:hypothetical protein
MTSPTAIAVTPQVVKEFGFSTREATYVADAFVVACFDARLDALADESLLHAYLRYRGMRHVDLVRRAGGPKALALTDPAVDKAGARALLEQLAISIRLHQTRRVILLMHQDCGALGGSAAFSNVETERRRLAELLRRAGKVVGRVYPQLVIELKLATFDGIYDVSA